MMSKQKTLLGVAGLLLLLAGMLLGRFMLPGQHAEMSAEHATDSASTEKKVLYWYDPMYPQQRFDEPGPSPFMDMDLVPRYADDSGNDTDTGPSVRIDADMVQNLGIRSATVTTTTQQSTLNVPGIIAFDDRALTRLQTPATALVEKVWPLASGDSVSAGQPLMRLRVPAWTGAQHEWLAVLDSGDDALIAVGQERLLSLGMPANLIARVQRERTAQDTWTVTAPRAGLIRSLLARAGMTLSQGSTIAEIQSLNPVWAEVAVAERQLQQVRQGDVVEVMIQGATPSLRQGQVAEVLPVVDPVSRTVQVRVTLPNDQGDLRPGMSAQVRIRSGGEQSLLAVPSEALLRTGLRTLVMLDLGDGRYQPREVQPGAELGALTQIVDGLAQGERVVVSGQFLLDSEASLQGIAVQTLAAEEHAHHTSAQADDLHYAEGTVEQFSDGKVLLDHGPFKSLPMPGMTMRFRLANEHVAHGIAEGDRVRIGVRDSDDGLIVELLEKLETTP